MRALFSWHQFDAARGWHSEPTVTAEGVPALALTSPVVEAPDSFSEAIPSWSATTPAGSWVEIQLRAEQAGVWSRWFRIAQWNTAPHSVTRRSFEAQRGDDGRVATDTLVLAQPAQRVQMRVLLCGEPQPTLQACFLALSAPLADVPTEGKLPAIELPVPPRSQRDYPAGVSIWCSPTSLTMILAYWHARTGAANLEPFTPTAAVPELTVPGVYDPVYEGHGNWIFNTAFAASQGLEAFVARFADLAELVPLLEAGVPVVISIGWKTGALHNAPINSSNGHLIVVAGFTIDGEVIVADPYGATVDEVRRVYRRAELEQAWQGNSHGTAYVVYPRGWSVPHLATESASIFA